jgi:hypothetical protein
MTFKPGMTNEQLKAEGYIFDNTNQCSGMTCRKIIEWWWTPTGKKLCLDPGTHIPHWGTCSDAKSFKKKA